MAQVSASRSNSRGSLVAAMLAGSWRQSPQANNLQEDDLVTIAPLLSASGAAALTWWQIRHSELRSSSVAAELERAYLLQSAYSALHEQRIRDAVAILRAVNVEPILVKGWAIARLYPEQGLRPYEDVDLCVRREQFSIAEEALKALAAQEHYYTGN